MSLRKDKQRPTETDKTRGTERQVQGEKDKETERQRDEGILCA